MARPRRPWFRFYVEAVHDRKLRRLPPAQRWLWVVVLAVARESPVAGSLLLRCDDSGVEPISEADLVDTAALKPADVKAGMAAFRQMGMLRTDPNLGCDVVAKWTERQYESDDVTTRTRKHRSKERPRNADGTFQGTTPEAEADTEVKQEQVVGTNAGPPDVAAAACRILAERAADAAPRTNRERYVRAVTDGKLADYDAEIARFFDNEPNPTAPGLADYLEPPTNGHHPPATCEKCGMALGSNHTDYSCKVSAKRRAEV